MFIKSTLLMAIFLGAAVSGFAEDQVDEKPAELDVLKASVGIWDAEIEVWAQGPDSASIRFKGVETNRAYGEHWIASDFDSEFMGQTMRVHSIVGYDLDRRKLVGTVIDHGPYSASMTGEYDSDTKTIHWTTEAKGPNGKPMVQKTSVTQKSADERVLVLSVPADEKGKFTRFMQIRFVRRPGEKGRR